MIFESWLPPGLAAALGLLLAALLGFRLAFWKPLLAMGRLDVGVMHLGYLAIVIQLLLNGIAYLGQITWVGSLAVHVFTFGAMGLIIPAMLIRISKGHTGRKVAFDGLDLLALRIMLLAFVARVVGPQIYPAGYLHWLSLAAFCWFACFGLLAWRYLPYYRQARVDGK